jgi:tryptophan-rich hypothetical protein
MNRFNPAKLQLSKWTALIPRNREKHFIVTKVIFDADNNVTHCLIEAVHSHREQLLEWQELRHTDQWQQGWL